MDSLKTFYYKNQDWLSTVVKGVGISVGVFMAGKII
jgi:hypothetical protein